MLIPNSQDKPLSSPTFLPFSVEKYNVLPEINAAHDKLSKALAAKGKKLGNLIEDPAVGKLFANRDPSTDYKFGICILHRHHKLKEDERMVSFVVNVDTAEMITQPFITPPAEISADVPFNVFADRWMHDGSEFEHTFTSKKIDPPPPAFFEKFREICRAYNVDGILGICTAELPLGVTPGSNFIILEQPDPAKDRCQRTKVVKLSDIPDDQRKNLRQSAWVPVRRPKSTMDDVATINTHESFTLSCLHNCTNHVFTLLGPTLDEKIEFDFEFDATPQPQGDNAN